MKVKARGGVTLIEVLVVIAVIVILLSLAIVATGSARETARKINCENNVKQLALASLSFESAFGYFPSGGWGTGWIGDPAKGVGRKQSGGYFFQLLPFCEQENLYVLPRDVDGTWDLLRASVPFGSCVSRRRAILGENLLRYTPVNGYFSPELFRSDYAMNGGTEFVPFGRGPAVNDPLQISSYAWPSMRRSDGICRLREPVATRDLSRGLSNTILIGEKSLPIGEKYSGRSLGDNESAYSGDDRDLLRYSRGGLVSDTGASDLSGLQFGSSHSVVVFARCDGSVGALDFSIDQKVLDELCNRYLGELQK